jgi:hypothetical protein
MIFYSFLSFYKHKMVKIDILLRKFIFCIITSKQNFLHCIHWCSLRNFIILVPNWEITIRRLGIK